jgi:hypothetical protein
MGIVFLFAIAQIGLVLCGGAQTSGMRCSKLRHDSLSALVEVASAPAHRGRFLDADDCSHFSPAGDDVPVGFFSFHGRCTAMVLMLVAGEASTWPSHLIVLGTHGRRGVGRMVLGAQATKATDHLILPTGSLAME